MTNVKSSAEMKHGRNVKDISRLEEFIEKNDTSLNGLMPFISMLRTNSFYFYIFKNRRDVCMF